MADPQVPAVERLRDLHRACDVAALAGRPLTTDEVRRLAGPVTDLGPAGRTGEALPRRDDAVAAWLERSRDGYAMRTAWALVNDLLDDYRAHADYGVPLDRDVHEPPCGDRGACPDGSCFADPEAATTVSDSNSGARRPDAPAEHPGVAELLRLCREWTAAKGDSAVLRCSLIVSTLTATTEGADRG